MQLTDKEIVEFQRIYEKEFGVKISKQDALEQGTKLLVLMKAIYQPIPSQGHKIPQKSSPKQ
ncbi:hypothetical protein A3K24_02515 [candidate division Kazan bacterium RIFCSPHIGHO2_01_FULL_44_14]|uniref:Uncharacterized protein n=1 Tax=candidate division Kazan bacterium RIFCSPLOWO2_01_FULL_45_19 TaxID=1798538 RepID=A0A1F4NQY0_UNCK3|nr:hypothetical protein [uncultured bacterium]AQS31112.1 hypothetical protein [uncultured bacterium]OGB73687.1 MAG: hypothetical protein A3K51_02515 [candidate division Kazan bacterium RIFCSPLOWO2_01_FULL_45_19]OGB77932.1 MAG: hypothetical protein A3K24_02515 [candidate division Kazan bacterium RIFCSPHIGHO2_01_FULL_44_14]